MGLNLFSHSPNILGGRIYGLNRDSTLSGTQAHSLVLSCHPQRVALSPWSKKTPSHLHVRNKRGPIASTQIPRGQNMAAFLYKKASNISFSLFSAKIQRFYNYREHEKCYQGGIWIPKPFTRCMDVKKSPLEIIRYSTVK